MITIQLFSSLAKVPNLNLNHLKKKTVLELGTCRCFHSMWLLKSPLSLAVPLGWFSPPNQSTIDPMIAAAHLFRPDI